MRPTWRQRLADAVRIEFNPAWRYALAGACCAVIALSVVLQNYRPTATIPRPTPLASVAPTPTPAPASRTTVPTLAVVPAAWQAEASRPQYVLDRIAITPASYETANVRF
jgi:hypothetical protein